MKCVDIRWGVVFALAAALAACASVSNEPVPDLQHQARSLQARRLDDKGLRVAEAHFNLPTAANSPWTPDRVTVAAWYFDPLLAQMRATATRQSADATLAAQRANPLLQLSPEKVFSGATATSPWTVGVALLLPLLHPGESAARRKVAAARIAMANDRLALAVWHSRVSATTALRRLLLARQAEALASRIAATQNAYRDGVRQRVAEGASALGAQLTAELEAQQAAAELSARTVQRVAAEYALAGAVGVPWTALRGTDLSWPQLDMPPPPSALPGATLAREAAWNRLDLAALLAQYRVAAAQLRAAAGTRYPTTAVAPGYIYDQGQRKFAFGVDLELPLFHGAGARIRAAAAARDEAAAAVRVRQAEILNSLDASRDDYTQRYRAWTRRKAAARAAQQVARRTRQQRLAGQVNRASEQIAEVAAAHARLASLDALSELLQSLAQLENAVQRPIWPTTLLTPPTAAVNPPSSSLSEVGHAPSS